MKITETQLQIMLRVLEGSLTICDRPDRNMFGYDIATRKRIYGEVINQQSKELIDVCDKKEEQPSPEFEMYKKSHETVEYILSNNDEIKPVVEKVYEECPERLKRKMLSNINALFLNVMLNRLEEVGKKGEERAQSSRLIIKEMIENHDKL
jgi:hypothetical protein